MPSGLVPSAVKDDARGPASSRTARHAFWDIFGAFVPLPIILVQHMLARAPPSRPCARCACGGLDTQSWFPMCKCNERDAVLQILFEQDETQHAAPGG